MVPHPDPPENSGVTIGPSEVLFPTSTIAIVSRRLTKDNTGSYLKLPAGENRTVNVHTAGPPEDCIAKCQKPRFPDAALGLSQDKWP